MTAGDPPADCERTLALLELALETAGMNAALVDTDLRHRWVHNDAPEPPESEIIGQTDTDLYDAGVADETTALKRDAIDRESRVEREFTLVKPTGQNRYRAAAEPTYDDDGAVDGARFVAVDVTESFRFLRRTTDAVFTVDDDWTVTFWDQRMAERTGIDPRAVVGRNLWSVFGDDIPPSLAEAYREVLATGDPIVQEHYFPAPMDYWVEVRAFADDDGLSVYSREVTDRKTRDQRLRETLERLRDVVDAASETAAAESAVELADDVLSLPLAGVHFASADGQRLDPVATTDRVGDVLDGAPTYHRADADDGVAALVWEVFDEDETVVVDDVEPSDRLQLSDTPARSTIVHPLGEYGVFITSATTPETVSETDRLLSGIVATTLASVLDRRSYERRLEGQRDNLRLLNEMLRHDVRNDLQLVLAYADALRDHVDEDAEWYLDTIREAGEHAVDLTTTAREMADVMLAAEEARARIDLQPVLLGEVETVRSTYPEATFVVEGSIPDVTVVADGMLDSVFRNLLKNAVQHNDADDPHVWVSVEADAETVTVRVADDGPGVPDAHKAAVFGKGEKGLGSEGTGLGLFLVDTLVDRYGGTVRIEDAETGGAAFVVELQRVVAD
jgi:signal transduction histidine kinase